MYFATEPYDTREGTTYIPHDEYGAVHADYFILIGYSETLERDVQEEARRLLDAASA